MPKVFYILKIEKEKRSVNGIEKRSNEPRKKNVKSNFGNDGSTSHI